MRILKCFELRPSTHNPVDSKAFRICIIAEDKTALLNSDTWAVGVAIRPWHRKSDNSGDVAKSSTYQKDLVVLRRGSRETMDCDQHEAGVGELVRGAVCRGAESSEVEDAVNHNQVYDMSLPKF